MKRTIFGLFWGLFFSLQLLSQSSNESVDFVQTRKSLFSKLEKREISTGFLSDYAVDLIPLERYDGVLRDSAYNDMAAQTLLYLTLSSAHIDEERPLPPAFNEYLTRCQEAPENALSLLLYRYNSIKEEVWQQGILSLQSENLC